MIITVFIVEENEVHNGKVTSIDYKGHKWYS